MAANSARTAIHRRGLSAPARWLREHGFISRGMDGLDYGCGYGTDARLLNIPGHDPHHHPNLRALGRQYSVVLCTYVANVLDAEERADLMGQLLRLIYLGGIAYVTVRRDVPIEGDLTRAGTWQESPDLTEEWGATLLHENTRFAIYILRRTS